MRAVRLCASVNKCKRRVVAVCVCMQISAGLESVSEFCLCVWMDVRLCASVNECKSRVDNVCVRVSVCLCACVCVYVCMLVCACK